MANSGSLKARILTPHGFVDGVLEYDGARLRDVRGTPVPAASVREGDRPIVHVRGHRQPAVGSRPLTLCRLFVGPITSPPGRSEIKG